MAQTKNVELRVIETSDVHGCFFPYDFIDRRPLKGSLARVSTYVKQLRQQYGATICCFSTTATYFRDNPHATIATM